MEPATRVVRSSCRGCHGVCQVLVHMEGDRVVRVAGDPDSPTSRGYLCPKGAAAPEILYHKERLTHPLKRAGNRGENKWERISWDEAISEIADRLDRVRRESGTEYFAVAQGTGRPYTEYTNRFAHAFGTPNFISPGHNCFLPRVISSAPHRRRPSRCRHLRLWGRDAGMRHELGLQPYGDRSGRRHVRGHVQKGLRAGQKEDRR